MRPLALAAPVMIAVTIAGGLTLPARAEPPHGGREGRPPAFDRLDADGDGRITYAEAQAFRLQRFHEMDADGDGKATAEEIEAALRRKASERAQRMVEHLDRDGDGALSAAEMPGRRGVMTLFVRADADGDGVVTRAEFDALRERMREHRSGNGCGEGGERRHGHHGSRGEHGRHGAGKE